MKKCTECINSRLVVSENGYHAICTLPESDSTDCVIQEGTKFEGNPLKGGESYSVSYLHQDSITKSDTQL